MTSQLQWAWTNPRQLNWWFNLLTLNKDINIMNIIFNKICLIDFCFWCLPESFCFCVESSCLCLNHLTPNVWFTFIISCIVIGVYWIDAVLPVYWKIRDCTCLMLIHWSFLGCTCQHFPKLVCCISGECKNIVNPCLIHNGLIQLLRSCVFYYKWCLWCNL